MAKRVYPKLCSVTGCDRTQYAHGFCPKHYKRRWKHGDPSALGKAEPGSLLRFLHVDAMAWKSDDCLIWPYGNDGAGGYATIRVKERRTRAHHYMCELVNGPAQESKPMALHTCDNKRCVNGRHLYWGDNVDNSLDELRHGKTVGRPKAA